MINKSPKRLLAALLLSTTMAANAAPSFTSNDERVSVVREYLQDLQAADASAITALFAPGGEVISTSQGRVNAAGFFSSFLPELSSAKVSIGQIYKGVDSDEHYSANFHFSWVMSDGSQAGGNYVDEFIFQKDTNKLMAVYMFENTKM